MADKPRRSSRRNKGKRRISGSFKKWSNVADEVLEETEDEQEENPLFPGIAMDISQGEESKHIIYEET